jgi:cytochrome c-type biogenesis protein CcmH/NrfG
MTLKLIRPLALIVVAGTLTACASGPGGGSIYVPADRDDTTAPEPPRIDPDESRVERKSEQPEQQFEQERRSPSYQEEGDELPGAAASLLDRAETLMADGDAQAAVSQLERAQRIAPRSALVYFRLSEAYVELNQLGSAEQFALKGLSLSGSDGSLQRSGWMLLADIRRARGNVAGADQAEERAGSL